MNPSLQETIIHAVENCIEREVLRPLDARIIKVASFKMRFPFLLRCKPPITRLMNPLRLGISSRARNLFPIK